MMKGKKMSCIASLMPNSKRTMPLGFQSDFDMVFQFCVKKARR